VAVSRAEPEHSKPLRLVSIMALTTTQPAEAVGRDGDG